MRYPLVVVLLIGLYACSEPDKRFRRLSSERTGIDFANVITERDTVNIMDMEFVYNGGGVAMGDLNGDGLEDLYFAGNQVDNKCYLNKGDLRFEDITEAAGLQKKPWQWSSGVNILDINCDGRQDIYVCNSINTDPELRRNSLYINTGNDEKGVPHFEESAKAYGLDDPGHSSHAQFFDYDNDGDLDVFIGVNFIDQQYPNQYITLFGDGSSPTRDQLFRNDWSDSLKHPVFTDVSLKAGIVWAGYSHSTLICDFNDDGWQDIYVANDYLSNDLIYVNKGDGTFTNRIRGVFKHQALSAMGSDLGDIDNDGRPDFVVTEMQPYYNKRKKLFQNGTNYQHYLYTEQYKYEYQYTRNVLQVNRGINPETGLPIFSEVGLYAGIHETDWSWTPLLADFDNDGLRDLYVTNGFPKDVTDHDFGEFHKSPKGGFATKDQLHRMIPEVKSPNFMFRNKGELQFEDVSGDWGLRIPSFTNGAAYGDLDNDGDLDLVANNIDDKAFVFENRSRQSAQAPHYLRVQLRGPDKNPDAFGARVCAYTKGVCQTAYALSGRGYLSKSEGALHFGLGAETRVDSLIVTWPDRRRSVQYGVTADQTLRVDYGTASTAPRPKPAPPVTLFKETAAAKNLQWKDIENDFVDFNFQRTIPHKFSQYGPSIAVGDVNGDGLDDIFLGGSSRMGENWFFQQKNGSFRRDSVCYKTNENRKEEDAGTLLFDADGDKDLDLYIARGSGQHPAGDTLYQDVLCVNDGKGRFHIASGALPAMTANSSCVKAADFDGDGDLDLFVGSRVKPKAYPMSDRSYYLRNDSEGPGRPRFTDATESVCPQLAYVGLVSDALWTDFDGDHAPDLILACEWSPLRFFRQEGGRLKDISAQSGVQNQSGWWNSLAAADFDHDGDMDYIAGNYGLNLYFRCTEKEPLRIYAKDFDNNGSIDPFISCYWKDSLGVKREYLYHPREDMLKQWVGIRKKFNTYAQYGAATVPDIFSKAELEGAGILPANWMYSSLIENMGNGTFRLHALPFAAQLAPIYGALPFDADADGRLDLLLVGNDFGMELIQGRADAFNGLVLLNRGGWSFEAADMTQSGFIVPGDARGLATLRGADQRELIIATQNRGFLRVFEGRPPVGTLALQAQETKAVLTFADGSRRCEELGWGSGFMSQKGRYLAWPLGATSAVLTDREGKTLRSVNAAEVLFVKNAQ